MELFQILPNRRLPFLLSPSSFPLLIHSDFRPFFTSHS
uniref:Uncharacterized protein n=1 Tax=Rhizophora mucronata TaxID=61149 RepID=A0A2P2N9F8_RHIMU